jgi:hypothetical protein
MSDYSLIYKGNLIITEHIIQSLKEAGINAIVKEQNESGLDPKIYGGHLLQEIHVHKDEFEEAQSIVKTLTSELDEV